MSNLHPAARRSAALCTLLQPSAGELGAELRRRLQAQVDATDRHAEAEVARHRLVTADRAVGIDEMKEAEAELRYAADEVMRAAHAINRHLDTLLQLADQLRAHENQCPF